MPEDELKKLKVRAKSIMCPHMESDEEVLLDSTVPKLLEFWSTFHFSSISGPKKVYGFWDELHVLYKDEIWIFRNANVALMNPAQEEKHHHYTLIFGSVQRLKENKDIEC